MICVEVYRPDEISRSKKDNETIPEEKTSVKKSVE